MRDTHETRRFRRAVWPMLAAACVLLAGAAIGAAQEPDPPVPPGGAEPPEAGPPPRDPSVRPEARPPRHGRPPREEGRRRGPREGRAARDRVRKMLEKRVAKAWLEKSVEERLALARQDRGARKPTTRRMPRTRFSRLFRDAEREAPKKLYDVWRNAPIGERPRRFVEIVNRHAKAIRDGRTRHGLARILEKMQQAGLVTESEMKGLLAIDDPQKRRDKYRILRDTAFLRQMKKAGRLDDAAYAKLDGEQDAAARRKGVDGLRRETFWKVNAHLIHFMLTPADQVKLRSTRFSTTFWRRIHRSEAELRIRFLAIFPAAKPGPLTAALRMTSEQEKAINRGGLSPGDKKDVAGRIFREQQAAVAHVMTARFGKPAAQRILRSGDPQRFYRRTHSLIDRLEPREGQGRGKRGDSRARRGGGDDEPGARPPGPRPGGKRPGFGPGAGPRPRPGFGGPGGRKGPGPRKAPKRGGGRTNRSLGGRGR